MSADDRHDRTLPASPRRRREARRQGQVPQSGDLAAATMLGGIAVLLMWQGPDLVRAAGDLLWRSFSRAPVIRGSQLREGEVLQTFLPIVSVTALFLIGLCLLAVVARLLQTGPLLSPHIVLPDTVRVSLSDGLRRMFSMGNFARSPMWGMRLIAVSGLLWWTLTHEADALARLTHSGPHQLAASLGTFVTTFALRLCGCLLIVGALDYGGQWWLHEQSLRMTPQEVRAERREAERAATRSDHHESQIGQPPLTDGIKAV